jgi:hypothetical protein
MTTPGGAHTSESIATYYVLGAPASIIGSEFPPHPRYRAPAFILSLAALEDPSLARPFALLFAENGGAWSRRSPFPLLGGIKAHILCEEIPHLG